MPPWAWYDWLLRIAGGLIMMIGLGVALWSLRGDTSRGRKRCPKCWYDMSGAVAREENGRELFTCPECGRVVKGERGLSRTRRRWTLAAWCMLYASVGWQIGWMGTPGREGLKAFVPTVVLIALERDFKVAQSSKRAVWLRLADGIVTPWDRWMASMWELHAADVDWDKMVRRRSKWPTDRPLWIHIGESWKLQSTFEYRTIEMWRKDEPQQVAVVHMASNYVYSDMWNRPPDYLDLPAPVLGVNTYVFTVRVRGQYGGWRSERVTINVEGVPSIDDVVVPDYDEKVTRELAQNLGWSIEYGGNEAVIALAMPEKWFSSRRTVSYAVRAKLFRGQDLASDATGGEATRPGARFRIWKWTPGGGEGPESIDLADLWVELSPAPDAALPDFFINSYWAGSLRVRLTDLPVFTGDYGMQSLRDGSAVKILPGDPPAYRQFVEGLPAYVPREIPLLPATGGKIEAEDEKK